jgi:phosphoribosylformylglycinamidine cyclo-ligase
MDTNTSDEAGSTNARRGLTYEQAGVSIAAQDKAIELIKPLAAATYTSRVLAGVGAFGAAFKAGFEEYEDPVLVSSTDGVGTKVKLAARFDAWENIGRDLVAVSVNDIITTGAAPLFFLDYIACHKLNPRTVERIVSGIKDGCLECGCVLMGGELAEMGEVYREGEVDLAGFAVGVVDAPRRVDGSTVVPGDVILGLPSSGLHSNGYSLVRKVFESLSEAEWTQFNPRLGCSLADEVLKPTAIYYRHLRELQDNEVELKAIAHVSGGGIPGNCGRGLAPGLDVRVNKAAIAVPAIFEIIAARGGVEDAEMWNTFNMGVGMTIVVAPEQADAALDLAGESLGLKCIGEIVPGDGKVVLY